jgi:aryl-alcohol dehydrogenase-like predicted oxidoreductase
MKEPRRVLKPESIHRECEASLRRLGVARIDLCQFHWPDETGTPLEDSWAEMVRLVDEGKVRAISVSSFDVRLLERSEAVRHVDSLQPPFSMINRSAATQEIPWCAAHSTGVICYSPMQSGLLTDGFTESRVSSLPADDWRRRAAEFQEPNLGRNLALRDSLRPLASHYNVSVGPFRSLGSSPGPRSPAQVDAWIRAASLELTPGDIDKIVDAIVETGAGQGPRHPKEVRARLSQLDPRKRASA